MAQALYTHLTSSKIFDTQSEAKDWAKVEKQKYKEADTPCKVDVSPSDATRRRWKVEVFLKV